VFHAVGTVLAPDRGPGFSLLLTPLGVQLDTRFSVGAPAIVGRCG